MNSTPEETAAFEAQFDDDIELSDTPCPNCKATTTKTRDCWSCGGSGEGQGYEDDPLWYDPGDFDPCPECRGNGFMHWCSECGYDFHFKRVL